VNVTGFDSLNVLCGNESKMSLQAWCKEIVRLNRSDSDCHRGRQPSAVKNDLIAIGLADLDVFDADAEVVVAPLGQVGVSLRPDPRDVRPRR